MFPVIFNWIIYFCTFSQDALLITCLMSATIIRFLFWNELLDVWKRIHVNTRVWNSFSQKHPSSRWLQTHRRVPDRRFYTRTKVIHLDSEGVPMEVLVRGGRGGGGGCEDAQLFVLPILEGALVPGLFHARERRSTCGGRDSGVKTREKPRWGSLYGEQEGRISVGSPVCAKRGTLSLSRFLLLSSGTSEEKQTEQKGRREPSRGGAAEIGTTTMRKWPGEGVESFLTNWEIKRGAEVGLGGVLEVLHPSSFALHSGWGFVHFCSCSMSTDWRTFK